MSIIIAKEGTKAAKIDKIEFTKECYLQEYIHQNPDSIPVYDIVVFPFIPNLYVLKVI